MRHGVRILVAAVWLVFALGACDDGDSAEVSDCYAYCDKLKACETDGESPSPIEGDCKAFCELAEQSDSVSIDPGITACASMASCEAFFTCVEDSEVNAAATLCKKYCEKVGECDDSGSITDDQIVQCKEACQAAAEAEVEMISPEFLACANLISCDDFMSCLMGDQEFD